MLISVRQFPLFHDWSTRHCTCARPRWLLWSIRNLDIFEIILRYGFDSESICLERQRCCDQVEVSRLTNAYAETKHPEACKSIFDEVRPPRTKEGRTLLVVLVVIGGSWYADYTVSQSAAQLIIITCLHCHCYCLGEWRSSRTCDFDKYQLW